jgi:hypothetical protein
MVGVATMADHLSGMAHEVTRSTKTHEGDWCAARRCREPAARARAEVVSGEIIGAAIAVHRQLGPGLLESVYHACLAQELRLRRIDHSRWSGWRPSTTSSC